MGGGGGIPLAITISYNNYNSELYFLCKMVLTLYNFSTGRIS